MPKFFVDPASIQGSNIYITGDDVNHITKVLRLSENDIIMVCDGDGKDYKVSIRNLSKKEVVTEIMEEIPCLTEPPVKVVLFQGIPKASKMEYIIQKNTELGISEIVPVLTHRTVVKIEDKKAETTKLDRWQKVALEAAKQCNRGRVPVVSQPIRFYEALDRIAEMDIKMMPYEKENTHALKTLLQSQTSPATIGILIGPEGGFEESEVQEAQDKGISTVTLGPRILRTETAGASVLSILMYEYE